MKKYIVWIVLAVILLWAWSGYNGLIKSSENVNEAWSNVETQYQRRGDLIDNLVSTVKGAAEFEKSTLTDVIEARSKATRITVDAKDLSPEKLQEFQRAQAQVSGALGRLLAVAENYPQLKSLENFRDLQSQLEGTENRIAESRRLFNEAARNYNVAIAKFPRVFLARMFGFNSKPYFQSDPGTEKAPDVKF